MSVDAMTEAEQLRQLMDSLPIFATRVGYRYDSTDEERRIGEAAFAAGRAWREAMGRPSPPNQGDNE